MGGVPNPCCVDLQFSVKIVAALNMIFDIFIVGLYSTSVTIVLVNDGFHVPDHVSAEDAQTIETLWIIAAFIVILISIGHFVLSLALYKGAVRRETTRCRPWLTVTVVLLFFSILTSLTTYYSMIGAFVGFLIQGYQIWIVMAFIDEVQDEQRQRTGHGRVQVVNYPYDYPTYGGPMQYPGDSAAVPPPYVYQQKV